MPGASVSDVRVTDDLLTVAIANGRIAMIGGTTEGMANVTIGFNPSASSMRIA